MKRRWRRRAGAALAIGLIAAAVAAVSATTQPSDQVQLERLVTQVEQGFESKGVSPVMRAVAPGYQDPEGLDRGDVYGIVCRLAREADSVDITIREHHIEVDQDRATGYFDVVALVTHGSERINWPMLLRVEFVRTQDAWWRPWSRRWQVESVDGHGMSSWLDGP